MATERRVLSSLDQLPEECQDDVVWALGELNQRQRTQADILFELNDRLAVKGHGPISKSAFSRRSVRLKRRADRLAERDHLYAGIADRISPEKMAEQDIVLGELLKAMVDEMIDGASTAEDVKELASAFRQVVIAQRHSAELKAKTLTEARKKVEKAIGEVEKTGRPVDGQEVLKLVRQAFGIEE